MFAVLMTPLATSKGLCLLRVETLNTSTLCSEDMSDSSDSCTSDEAPVVRTHAAEHVIFYTSYG